jgi:STAS domain
MTAPRPRPIVCDVSGLAATAGTIDMLARLQLTARRRGHEIQLRNPSTDLLRLLEFAGLAAALPVEPGREPEQREHALGVKEERELGDPAS